MSMKRFKHSLSNYRLLTCDMGELVPVGCLEVLPGDTFQHRTSTLIRLSPQIAPVMHPIQIRLHHWFVPNRLMWDDWEDFITGGPDGTGAGTAYPVINPASVAEGSLLDYLGVPTQATPQEVAAFPVIAYNMIWNEWYRDQDLVPLTPDLLQLGVHKVAWGRDYFTSARPWTQKGPDVSVPISGSAMITGLGASATAAETAGPHSARESDGTNPAYASYYTSWGADGLVAEESTDFPGYPNIKADLSTATAGNINDWRRAFALQRYQEARARYGSRYTEYLAYLGIRASDQRLQRPEFLGGGRGSVAFSEVLQTADRTGSSAVNHQDLGALGGHGISALRSRPYRRFFEEHGWVLTLMSVRPKTMYMDGLHRKFSRRTKEDYYQKELEAIGQQAILDSEVYSDGSTGATWGYADRYRDYREEPSHVSGDFRSTLNYWHLARDFASAPALNESFVECDPSKRIFAEQTNDALWCMVNHSVQARRMVNRNAAARIM